MLGTDMMGSTSPTLPPGPCMQIFNCKTLYNYHSFIAPMLIIIHLKNSSLKISTHFTVSASSSYKASTTYINTCSILVCIFLFFLGI